MRVSMRVMSGTDVNLAVLRMAARSAVDQHNPPHRAAAGALDAGEQLCLAGNYVNEHFFQYFWQHDNRLAPARIGSAGESVQATVSPAACNAVSIVAAPTCLETNSGSTLRPDRTFPSLFEKLHR